ncbi:MAG: nitroreductase family protein [Oscillospiraceae bacterium]|nr:nitroreductase family protein [Oscillospiraceae bacterium]
MSISEIMRSRRSIRKFLSEPISDEEINELISAAVTAPSGCNSQCWYFAAVKNPEKISALAEAAELGVRRFYNDIEDENFLSSRIKQTTFFRNAPLVICVFLTHMEYHDPRVTEYYRSKGFEYDEMLNMLGAPDILSIGAAVENLLLKAKEMGLGACWMNDPTVAEKEIKDELGIPEEYRLMSVIPIGKPAYTPREKQMKPMSDVLKIL